MIQLKPLLFLLGAFGYHLGTTHQGSVQNAWEVVNKIDLRPPLFVRVLSSISSLLVWSVPVAVSVLVNTSELDEAHTESITLLRLAHTRMMSIYCPAGSNGSDAQSLLNTTSNSFFIGVALSCIGGALRVISSRTLGYMYNASLNLQPAHVLVMEGPYSYIRHPGYAGALLAVIGFTISALDLTIICDISHSHMMVKWCIWSWLAWNFLWTAGLFLRAAKEDKILSNRFGIQWKHWAWTTPKWFIPWIF